MRKWLTSMNQKRHQRAINRLVRDLNKNLEQDDLWLGRFVVRQIESPQWIRYEDGSGAELYVTLELVDRFKLHLSKDECLKFMSEEQYNEIKELEVL